MKEKDYPNIEELLNSFIDDELSERQRTEVQRILAHDSSVAAMVDKLRRTKQLVGALPREAAPMDLLENVKASLERSTLLDLDFCEVEEKAGRRELLLRRCGAIAAMVVLFGALAILVYSIVGPYQGPAEHGINLAENKPFSTPAEEEALLPEDNAETREKQPLSTPAIYTLELKTEQRLAVNAAVHRAIYDNNLLSMALPPKRSGSDKTVYQLRCYAKHVKNLLDDLQYIWNNCEQVRLAVSTRTVGEEIVINDVSTEQIEEVLGQTSFFDRIKTAQKLAVLNELEKSLPAAEMLAAVEAGRYDTFIAKPVLTSGEYEPDKEVVKPLDGEAIFFVVVIVSNQRN
ncbi:MAG: hypothetical protein ABIG61_10800 [Planctomycetota bacterium]